MARLFDDGSSQYLEQGAAVVAAIPLSMSCWFKVDDVAAIYTIMSIQYNAGQAAGTVPGYGLRSLGTLANDPLGAWTQEAGGGALFGEARQTGIIADTWHHACGVWATAFNDRRALLDGTGTSDTTSVPTPTPDRTLIAAQSLNGVRANFFSGDIAEAAIWDVALTDAEVAVLATGIRPILVRPQNIVAYWPLVRDQDYDIVGGYGMTPIGGPTISAHAPVIYGATPGLFGEGARSTNLYPGLSGLSGLTGLTPIMGDGTGG